MWRGAAKEGEKVVGVSVILGGDAASK